MQAEDGNSSQDSSFWSWVQWIGSGVKYLLENVASLVTRVDKHDKLLGEHAELLKRHGERLDKHEDMMRRDREDGQRSMQQLEATVRASHGQQITLAYQRSQGAQSSDMDVDTNYPRNRGASSRS